MTNEQTPLNMIVELDAMSMYIARLKQQFEPKNGDQFGLFPKLKESNTKVTLPNEVVDYIKNWVDLDAPGHVTISETIFETLKKGEDYTEDLLTEKTVDSFVAPIRINDIRYINKFFESLNKKLPEGGILVGNVKPSGYRKKQVMSNMVWPFNIIFYSCFYLIKRVFPKVRYLKNIYFAITKGKNRVLSEMETYGRLYSCGFKLLDSKHIGGRLYFIAQKQGEPSYNTTPTYGPLIGLNRVGKDGKLIKVYKVRSMYPYSEYMQQWVFEKQGLQDGGKIKDDPRVTTVGKILRKYWLDELPMLINIVKGELKIVGVRPVSQNYLKNVYPAEFLEYRKKFKPGFIPPFYVDLPKTTEEIIASEERYLKAYEKDPMFTDLKYLIQAFSNVLFKNARSN